MEKVTYLIRNKSIFSRFMGAFAAFLLMNVNLLAQDVLLGQYEFITGPDQEKATNVLEGLTFSGALEYTNSDHLTAVYENDAVVISGWLPTSQNISQGRCVQFTVNKDVTLDQFKVSKVIILYKRTPEDTSFKITFTVAPTVNTGGNAYRIWNVKEVYYVGPEFDLLSIEEDAILYPTVTDNNPRYFSFTPQAADAITIDKIEVWGTVVEATEPNITADIASKTFTASQNHPYSFPVKLSGLYLDETTTLSFAGTNSAYFEIDKASLTVEELNGQEVTVNVTYDASTVTHDAVTSTNTPHEAVLQIANPGFTTIEIPITATCYVLFEDFSKYDGVTSSGEGLSAWPSIPGNNILTHVPGWVGDYLYAYRTGSTYGSINLASSQTDSAYLYTPEIDLSQPFSFSVVFRSFIGGTDGRLFVYLDDEQLIFSGLRTSNSILDGYSETFVGTANSKLKFTGLKNDLNQMIVDDIIVNYSNNPALNIAKSQIEDLGVVIPNANKIVNIPLKGYNLTGDVTLSLQNGTTFSINSGTTIAQATATVGTTIDVQFAAPEAVGAYEDVLTLTTSEITRSIVLKASSDTGTELAEINQGKIKIHADGVELSGYQGKNVRIFAITGVKIAAIKGISSNEFINITTKGSYILRIEDELSSVSKKIIVQ